MIITTDKTITYDMDVHLYIPQETLFTNRLNVSVDDFGGADEFKVFQYDCAEFIRDFCVYYSSTSDKFVATKQYEVLVYLNNFDEVANLKRAYVEYARYALDNEGDKLGNRTGVDFNKMMSMGLDQTRGYRELSSRLNRILKNTRLLFEGKRVWDIDDLTDAVRGTDY